MSRLGVVAFLRVTFLGLCLLTTKFVVVRPASKPDWPNPNNLPQTTERGQFGYNRCRNQSSQTSNCQTLYVNSLTDFCVWAPPSGQQEVGNSEEYEVAWCTQANYGTRQIPAGAVRSAHFISTPQYVQITGAIDGPALNILRNDAGGELDPHGATGNGNPIGSLVYTTAFGHGVQQVKEWMNFMGDGEFCFRICNPRDPNAWLYCQHIYDLMGCGWVMPGNYKEGFDSCEGDSVPPPGVYGTSTFQQGDLHTPDPHPAASSSSCQAIMTVGVQPTPSLGQNAPSLNSTSTTNLTRPTARPSPANVTVLSTSEGTSATVMGNNGIPLILIIPVIGFQFVHGYQ